MKVSFRIIAALSSLLFLLSAGIYLNYYIDLQLLHKEMKALRESKQAIAASPGEGSKLAPLYEQNNDIVGWLSIEGTSIDYPVMQTPENEVYYLDKDFTKKDNRNGLPILDTACDFIRPSDNLIIHGHNMKNGMMFAELLAYEDEGFCREHPFIHFDTLYRPNCYRVVAVFYSQVYYSTDQVFKYYQFTEAGSRENFNQFINNIRSLSLYDTGVIPAYGDKLLTLSTCSYHTENGRFVVVARREADSAT
ncbi:hypothetical protein Desor_2689 [Desulfosporosinus orientis DSM 765]|uniref:Sortase, SrtB family n=1 Tax=Desulfosporosinus orientis (strain ATCC 19365 / DSM 765 / NCIMB 8382 / VKM B-1628 / Singapore I) TaxID=768706 RepID=G7W925_DESOD|nr:class B sortase [Desulfosporosinus orientis]AET68234.1 hypothetical protein Desor_2689 [Desulfosporosinus orientis DSM 765]